MTHIRTISPTIARRLAIARQGLAGDPAAANSEGILQLVRDLGCLQLDPISVVARSHLLVLWSRLGTYEQAHLDTLLWQERQLFEYWAHAASIVLTEDYHLHSHMMRTYATSDSNWGRRVRKWVDENIVLHNYILDEIKRKGPLLSRQFESDARTEWASSGWTSGRNINQMLDYLWTKGTIMVAGRSGGQKLWDLTEHCLPEWTPRHVLSEGDVVKQAVQKSLHALGVATSRHIQLHFMRYRYPGIAKVLNELEAAGTIERVQIEDDGKTWPGPWYIHAEDVPLLERLQTSEWEPRTTLLSPFDNLICDRARTELLFDYNFRIEIYVPKAQRKYGYYVLSILHGDTLIGRIDPSMDRKKKRLTINAVHAEPGVPLSLETGQEVSSAVEKLGAFLGANEIVYTENVPDGWKQAFAN